MALTHAQVLDTAVRLADRDGLATLSMRALARELGVEAMSLYHHVAGKEALLGFDFIDATRHRITCQAVPLRMAFAAIANVIERDSMERDRVRLETDLQQARRLETVGTFASGIAHNFNNLMAAIIAEADLAQSDLPAGSPAYENAERIASIATARGKR